MSRPRSPVAAAPWISTVVRLVLAVVFVVAGVAKALDPQASVVAVRAYQLLPTSLETPVGWGLPFVEIVLGALLAAGVATRACGVAAVVLLAGFLAGVASAAVRGLSIDCGCFGGGGAIDPGQTRYAGELVRDSLLLLLALGLVWRPESRWALDLAPAGPVGDPRPAAAELERAR